MSDYYETLGIPRDASAEQIKKAYRKLAMEHHPDRNRGSEEASERFKQLSEAYEVLRDPNRRARYDRFGKEGVAGGRGGGPFQGFDLHDAIEIFMRDFGGGGFEEIFGGRRRGVRRSRKGESVRVRLPLTLAEVVRGARKRVRVALLDPCETCGGGGSADGGDPTPCATCGGTGQEQIAQRSVLGQFVSLSTCRACAGEGVVIRDPCRACRGEGRARREIELDVEVPAGVTSENFITLRGKGNAGARGGPRGDVMVLLDIQPDPRFLREGNHLVVDVPITFAQAALGSEIEVPTVEGTVRLDVPPGIQSGQALRVRGHGVPDLEGRGRGDLVVRVRVWTPEALSPEQHELMLRLRELEDAPPAQPDGDAASADGRRSFWSRVKESFTP